MAPSTEWTRTIRKNCADMPYWWYIFLLHVFFFNSITLLGISEFRCFQDFGEDTPAKDVLMEYLKQGSVH